MSSIGCTTARELVFPSPQDPLVGSLSALMVALDALGDDAGADRVEGELEAHVERLGRAYDRAYSLCFRALLASLRRNYPMLRARADEALTVCNEQSYPIYSAIASFYKGVAVGHLENVDAGLHMAMTAFDALDRIGCKHARSLRHDDIARLRMAMGDIGDALSLIDIAIAESIASGETFPLPILRRPGQKSSPAQGRPAPRRRTSPPSNETGVTAPPIFLPALRTNG